MAIRLERVIRVLMLLQSGVPFNAAQLAQELGVHRRTVFRDIGMLRDIGLRIQFDDSTGRYWLPADVRLPGDNVLPDELCALLLAARVSYLSRDSQQQKLATRAATKLSRSLPKGQRAQIARLMRSVECRLPPAQRADDEVLSTALRAIGQRLTVRVILKSSSRRRQRSIRVVPGRLTATVDGWQLSGQQLPGLRAVRLDLLTIESIDLVEAPPFSAAPRTTLGLGRQSTNSF